MKKPQNGKKKVSGCADTVKTLNSLLLCISHQADEVQDVMHFNFTAWPDHGVPTTNAAESILQFVQMVRQKSAKTKGPMVIHCR